MPVETMPARRSALVYHNELLPYSATFIRTQAAAIKAFDMGFAGLFPSRQASLDLRLDFGPILFSRTWHSFDYFPPRL
jgi:hypothetical protein